MWLICVGGIVSGLDVTISEGASEALLLHRPGGHVKLTCFLLPSTAVTRLVTASLLLLTPFRRHSDNSYQFETSREWHKSAPYLRLKNSKRTSKCQSNLFYGTWDFLLKPLVSSGIVCYAGNLFGPVH